MANLDAIEAQAVLLQQLQSQSIPVESLAAIAAALPRVRKLRQQLGDMLHAALEARSRSDALLMVYDKLRTIASMLPLTDAA